MSVNPSRAATLFYTAGGVVAIVAALYFARPVLIPFTVSVLLTFLLTPVVGGLVRLRFPRVLAVLVVAAGAFLLLGGLGYMVGRQVSNIAQNFPQYRANIEERVRSVQRQTPAAVQRLYQSFLEFQGAAEPEEEEGQAGEEQAPTRGQDRGPPPDGGRSQPPPSAAEQKRPDGAERQEGADDSEDRGQEPVRVKVAEQNPVLEALRNYLVPALSPFATLGLVIIFTLFMLLQPPDLGYRLGRLVGEGRTELTTQMLDEVGRRIARYLLMQLLINAIYGVAVAILLWIIGLPGALLWGLLCTVLRFIPYIGPWVAAAMPIALSFAAFSGWAQPLVVIGMFLLLELLTNNLLEPWLYGTTTGLSAVAVLVAMVFWGWLWGGVGILLAIPMTVCLVVAGKYIPALRVFPMMLGDQSTISSRELFHQYLTTEQRTEALQMAHNHALEHGWESMYDRLWLPVLALIRHERQHGWLEGPQAEDALAAAAEVVQQLTPWQRETLEMHRPPRDPGWTAIRCVPAGDDPADRLAADTLARLLRDLGYPEAESVEDRAQLGAVAEAPSAISLILALSPRSFGRAAALSRALGAGGRALTVLPAGTDFGRFRRWYWGWWRRQPVHVVHGYAEAIRAVRSWVAPDRPRDAAALLHTHRRRRRRRS